ncbi:MAG TPA: L-tyrosine/L-tryptophan isonitrile synthase family protein [Isosphaeraceae bacterium]|nr:L-tyrosine/L-tryptophan isonitrile synthase family protein [Isosphaeraceae bacterium]
MEDATMGRAVADPGQMTPIEATRCAEVDSSWTPGLGAGTPIVHVSDRATSLAQILLRARKPAKSGCSDAGCPTCEAILRRRLLPIIEAGKPVEMVISAFPYKIPNPRKTLGTLPDESERVALKALAGLCRMMTNQYSPGTRVVIGSDGLPFSHVDAAWSDLEDDQIREYVRGLRGIIREIGASDVLRVTSLDDFMAGEGGAAEMRARLEREYAEIPREAVHERFKDTPMYAGIKRAFTEDLADSPRIGGLVESGRMGKKALRRMAGELAVETIYYSMAWRNLLSANYPDAIRLSIHPECLHLTPYGKEKLGVRFEKSLGFWIADRVREIAEDETTDISPWQSAWVEDRATGQGCRMKRWVAERIGAELVVVHGRPSHFVIGS